MRTLLTTQKTMGAFLYFLYIRSNSVSVASKMLPSQSPYATSGLISFPSTLTVFTHLGTEKPFHSESTSVEPMTPTANVSRPHATATEPLSYTRAMQWRPVTTAALLHSATPAILKSPVAADILFLPSASERPCSFVVAATLFLPFE